MESQAHHNHARTIWMCPKEKENKENVRRRRRLRPLNTRNSATRRVWLASQHHRRRGQGRKKNALINTTLTLEFR